MKLEFNSTDELQDFLDWSLRYGVAWAASQRRGAEIVTGLHTDHRTRTPEPPDTLPPFPFIDDTLLDTPQVAANAVAFDTPPEGREDALMPREFGPGITVTVGGAGGGGASAEPAKRKRRTKAEIEAAAAAEKKPEEAQALANVAAERLADPDTPEGRAAAIEQMRAEDPTSGVAPPLGANPFEQAPAGDAGSDTPAADDAAAGDEVPVVTPVEHLTRARAFLAKHGMPRYNESFAKAGLDPNVMGYSSYQRALHVAALDEMEKA